MKKTKMSDIQFKKLVLKNFLSFGSHPTEIDLRGNRITVVLGLNHDTGGDESRNGVGKSAALIDSISYALFGKTFRGISNAKLVNKLARKGQGMLVVLELDTPSGSYRIERGEAPSKLKLFRKDLNDDNEILLRDGKKFVYDISRNKSETTTEIENLLGFDIKLFEFLVANTSESIPFMKLPEDKKREIAERLMGLNLLTERAEELKEERRVRKRDLISAESSLAALNQANARIQKQIDDLLIKESNWDKTRDTEIEELRNQIESMEKVDINEQIEILELLDQIESSDKKIQSDKKQTKLELRQAQRDLKDLNIKIDNSAERFEILGKNKDKIESSECPTCGQHWVADPSVLEDINTEIDKISDFSEQSCDMLDTANAAILKIETHMAELKREELELAEYTDDIGDFYLVFDDIGEASKASGLVDMNKARLETLKDTENPHSDTIKGLLKDVMKKAEDTEVRELRRMIEHYNYLIDLLQSKDSFLRKAVIDRWLPKLNERISHYLEILELPFNVRIENDLTMSIRDFGEDFDWGNLSRGQRQRVVIATNLAFQDLFESTNKSLSLLLVDELIDAGVDPRGSSQVLQALQETCDSKDKRVFLITHRLDIADQVTDVMLVELRNRISRVAEDDDEA